MGGPLTPAQEAHLSSSSHLIFRQQLRQQDTSGMDLEEKEEMDNPEGEPRTLDLCPSLPCPRVAGSPTCCTSCSSSSLPCTHMAAAAKGRHPRASLGTSKQA